MVVIKTVALLMALVFLIACGPSVDRPAPLSPRSSTVAVSENVSFDRAEFSPDGRKVAFLAVDKLGEFVVGILRGDRPHILWEDGEWPSDFAWMPNSRELLLAVGPPAGPSRLVVINMEGTVERQTDLSHDLKVADGISVRPDGESAVVSAQRPGPIDKPADLYEVSLSTGELTSLTETPELSEAGPTLIVSGDIVFERSDPALKGPDGIVSVLRSDGSTERISSESQLASDPSAIPGSDVVVFGTFGSDDVGRNELWAADVSRGQREMLFPFEGTFPNPHPDGGTILYVEVTPPGAPSKLMTRPLDLPEGFK